MSQKLSPTEYEAILNSFSDIVYIYDIIDSRFTYSNTGLMNILGYSVSDVRAMGQNLLTTLLHPEDLDLYHTTIVPRYHNAEDGESIENEFRMKHKDGSWCWLHSRESVFKRQADGKPKQISGVVRDITESKRAKEALEASENRFKTLYEAAGDAIFLLEITSGGVWITDCNSRTLEIFGCDAQDIIGKSPAHLSPPSQPDGRASAKKEQEMVEAALAGVPQFFEWLHCRLDGTLFNAEVSLNRIDIGGQVRLQAIVRDVTERKRLEDVLIKSEEKYAKTFRSSPDSITLTSMATGRLFEVNRGFEEISGYTRQEVLGKTTLELNIWKNAEERDRLTDLLKSEGRVHNFEAEAVTKKGDVRLWSISAEVIELDEEPCLLVIARDITEQRETENTLRRERDFNTTLIERSPTYYVAMSSDGKIIMMNQTMIHAMGYDTAEVMGQNYMSMFVPEREHGLVSGFFDIQVQGGNIHGDENHIVTKDGRERLVEWYGASVVDDNKEPLYFWGMGIDVTERKLAEEDLRQARELLKAALTQSPSGILIADAPDVKIRMANLAGLGIRGGDTSVLTDIDVSKHSIRWQIFRPDGTPYPPEQLPLSRAVLQGETTRDEEVIIRDEDGQDRWVTTNAGPVRNENGEIVAGIVTFHDVTKRKQALEELKNYQKNLEVMVAERTLELQEAKEQVDAVNRELTFAKFAIDNAPDPIFWLRPEDASFFYTNDRGLQLLDYSRDELLKMSLYDIDPQYTNDKYPERLKQLRQQNRMIFETTLRRKDKTRIPVEISAGSLTDEGEDYILAFCRDISEKKRAQLELQEAKEVSEAANKAKSVFLANMSHEIRTPMNAILGYSQLLLRDRTVDGEQRQHVDAIHRSGGHLLDLINDILEMSKIEAGRTTLRVDSFDLRALLGEVEIMFQELTSAKGVGLSLHLDSDLPRSIEADSGKVLQVVINLMSNAVKFTRAGQVGVRAFAGPLAKDKHTVTLIVEDTGCGIEPEHIDRIFDAFEQSAIGTLRGGTGLGMAISRSFAQLMNGDLTVESTLGQGSCFTFTFEAGKGGAVAVRGETTPILPVGIPSSEKRRKVLVVDDTESNRYLLDKILSGIGFQTRTASSGEEAIDEHDTWQPDLILIDLRMPGIGGQEAIRRLRNRGSTTPIIAISASVFPDIREEAMVVGADGFLARPHSDVELFAKIEDLLGIEFLHADQKVDQAETPSQSDPSKLAAALFDLPEAVLEELREATISAQIGRIETLIDRIADQSPEVARQLRLLTERFEYERVIEILDRGSLS